VVQETLLAFIRVAQDHEIRAPESYLARAVRWNAVKHRARRRVHSDLGSIAEPSAGDDPNRLDAIELERAVADLPVAQQTVIRLRFYLGLTFREIGKNLSISTNTAASRTRYALANLRRRLGGPQTRSNKEAHNG
jgi:RNA polymerase sigma-70 factor (ECF subfamily)